MQTPEFQLMAEPLISFIGQLVLQAGGAAAVAYAIFRLLGSKFVENQFEKNLENHKAALNQDFERYRYEINSLFNRITMIHDKEIEVLPMAWSKLQETLTKVVTINHPIQHSSDLEGLTVLELEEFLEGTNFKNSAKEKIRSAHDKNQTYEEVRNFYRLSEAYEALADFHKYIQHNRIFLSSDLFLLFKKVDDTLKSSLIGSELGITKELPRLTIEAYEKFAKEAVPIADEIEKAIQKRLHHSEAN